MNTGRVYGVDYFVSITGKVAVSGVDLCDRYSHCNRILPDSRRLLLFRIGFFDHCQTVAAIVVLDFVHDIVNKQHAAA